MYQQIIEQIKLRIAIEDWVPGDKLPSIRELAIATEVSVITVKRAYLELERENVIVTQQGKGSFVAEFNTDPMHQQNQEMKMLLRDATKLAILQGISLKELKITLEKIYKNMGKEHSR